MDGSEPVTVGRTCSTGQNPLRQFTRSKYVTNWRLPENCYQHKLNKMCLTSWRGPLCRVVTQLPLQRLVAYTSIGTFPLPVGLYRETCAMGFGHIGVCLDRVLISNVVAILAVCLSVYVVSHDNCCPC